MNDNEKRSERGRDLIEYYLAEETHASIHEDDFRAAAVDALTDILHTLDAQGHDAVKASDMARRHFLAEHSHA